MDAWLNGKFVDWREVLVSPLSHGVSRGVMVFEVIQILNTEKGPAFLCFKEHLARFYRSAKLMHMDPGISEEDLKAACLETAKHNGVKGGVCKFMAYYPTVELYPIPQNREVSIAIYCADYEFFGFNRDRVGHPVKVGVPSIRKMSSESVPIQAKVTGNYVGAYLAAVEMAEKGYDAPLLLDGHGYITEGITNAAFFVKDGLIKTAPLTRVLASTTRGMMIQVARDLGYEVQEADIRVEELHSFDEAFSSSSMSAVNPFESINGIKVGTECPGPVTRKLAEHMKEVYKGRIQVHDCWLNYVD